MQRLLLLCSSTSKEHWLWWWGRGEQVEPCATAKTAVEATTAAVAYAVICVGRWRLCASSHLQLWLIAGGGEIVGGDAAVSAVRSRCHLLGLEQHAG